jgi:hypothetical protein
MELLKVGDVIELKHGMKIQTDIPRALMYSNRRGDYTLENSSITISEQFAYLTGKYIVCHAQEEHDSSISGYKVYCLSPSHNDHKNETTFTFYQTGGYETKNEFVPVIGKAIQTWEIK